MNKRKILFIAFGVMSLGAYASGFSLYQPSATGHAFGGALVGRAMDGSANFYNPATLTDIDSIMVTAGFVTEHPRCRVRVNGGREHRLDPGFFVLPHFQLAVPLPADFAFGIGVCPEFGLGTKYSETWPMNWNATETTVQSIVFNPNLAYKITDDWSIGAGLRLLYFDFEQYKYDMPLNEVFRFNKYHLKGDNGFEDLGWQIGTKYDILDNLSLGIVYKSKIDVTVKGHTTANSAVPAYDAVFSDKADADLELPQSVTAGVNWDPAHDWHVGASIAWTEWSSIDTLVFNVKPQPNPIRLDWKDTWRASFGVGYDFLDDWTFMMSYVYDMDSTSKHQTSVMLPPSDRHILGGGLSWRFNEHLSFTLSYTCIFMAGGTMETTDVKGGSGDYRLKASDGFCHAGGFSITYAF